MQSNDKHNLQDIQSLLVPGQLVFQISGYFGIVLGQYTSKSPSLEPTYLIMLGNGLHELCKGSEVVALWLPGNVGYSPQQFPELIESYRRAQIVDSRTQCQICSGAGYINYLTPDGYGDADAIPESCPVWTEGANGNA